MTTNIITIHYGINYGSALQAFSLSSYLKNRYPNNEVTVINYIPPRYSVKARYFPKPKQNCVLDVAYLLLSAPNKIRYQRIFNKFLRNRVPLGKTVYSIDGINKYYGKADLYITGSDQVWNTDYNGGIDRAYYLDFGQHEALRISYAASCGKTAFNSDELEVCIPLWMKLDGISLREDSGCKLFNEIGIEATQVLDPIFLLSEEDWGRISGKREIKENYLFIYGLEKDEENILDIACEIAKEKKLKIVMISYGHIWSNNRRVDYYLRGRSPEQFLSLISNASFVVTNSFHGVAFSLRFRKQFLAISRKKYNGRLESIIRLTHTEDRLIDSLESYHRITDIDYDGIIAPKIEHMENVSKQFIEKWIRKAEKLNKT